MPEWQVETDSVYYGFLAVGQRQRLAALKKQLNCSTQETPSVIDDAIEDEQAPGVSRQTEVRCPSCGQVMQQGAVIQPTAHSPP